MTAVCIASTFTIAGAQSPFRSCHLVPNVELYMCLIRMTFSVALTRATTLSSLLHVCTRMTWEIFVLFWPFKIMLTDGQAHRACQTFPKVLGCHCVSEQHLASLEACGEGFLSRAVPLRQIPLSRSVPRVYLMHSSLSLWGRKPIAEAGGGI